MAGAAKAGEERAPLRNGRVVEELLRKGSPRGEPMKGQQRRHPRRSGLCARLAQTAAQGEDEAAIAAVTGFGGRIVFDETKPDGTARKLMDVSKLRELGWSASIPLKEGLAQAYRWFLEHQANFRG
jgi:dTDP-D-glucose 4,6-dehydratase